MSSKDNNLDVDVFWSMRSPYCYISLNRCLEMRRKYNFNLNLRIVYPIAIKDPDIVDSMAGMKYRLPYQVIDPGRTAHFHGVPYAYPVPDVVKQEPGFGAISPYEEQGNVRFLTRCGVAAADIGKGWDYLNEVMRLVWNGQKIHWDQDDLKQVRAAIEAAGIDAKVIADVEANGDKYDAMIQKNMDLQETNDCQHEGVPCFVFRNEPFFGQDRMEMLIWRLKQYGLTERADYEPSLRAAIDI